MGTSEDLRDSVRHTHDGLAKQLHALEERYDPDAAGECGEGPRRGCAPIDEFITAASRHVHAVDAVVLPRVRRKVPDGKQVAHDYLLAARELEVALAHAKAHEYGSVWERRYPWSEVWADIEGALAADRRAEEELADQLSEAADDEELTDVAERLAEVEPTTPTRPHPYLPHMGVLGAVTRKVARATDAFWDTAEGRMLPAPPPRPRKRPGLVGQYLLGDPRWDEKNER